MRNKKYKPIMSKRIKPNPFSKAENQCRYTPPQNLANIEEKFVKYKYAQQLADDIKIARGQKVTVIANGSFIFGDFIEAFILKHKIKCKKMVICTLSYNQNNVDSLKNLMQYEWIDDLEIITSGYFYRTEKLKGRLVEYTYKQLDSGKNNFQLSFIETHMKVALIETYNGSFIVMQGSANLRSCQSVEQFSIEENKELHAFYKDYFNEVSNKNKTINKYIKN